VTERELVKEEVAVRLLARFVAVIERIDPVAEEEET
jgi:hypothetical protein